MEGSLCSECHATGRPERRRSMWHGWKESVCCFAKSTCATCPPAVKDVLHADVINLCHLPHS
jgi:hypothetical protein